MRAWTLLVAAGMLEIAWAIGLKYSEGFTRPAVSVATVAAVVASMGLLGLAVRELPIGTAYAVWTGIGAVGAAVFGMLLLGEPGTPMRIISIVLIVAGIVGLKLGT